MSDPGEAMIKLCTRISELEADLERAIAVGNGDMVQITRAQASQALKTLDALGLALANNRDLPEPLGSEYEIAAASLSDALKRKPLETSGT